MKRPADDKRNLIWKHNSFLGHCVMMRKQLLGIIAAETTTEQSVKLVQEMLHTLHYLERSLKTRKDQE